MKAKTNSHHKPHIIALVIVALFLAIYGGAQAYAMYFSPETDSSESSNEVKPSGTVDYGEATDEQKDAGADQKDQTDGGNVSPGVDPDAGPSLNITITHLAQDTETGIVQIRNQIDFLSNNGECTLTLTKGSETVTKTAGVQQAGATISTCKGFNISTSELATGKWEANITVIIGDRKGSATQSFTVQ